MIVDLYMESRQYAWDLGIDISKARQSPSKADFPVWAMARGLSMARGGETVSLSVGASKKGSHLYQHSV